MDGYSLDAQRDKPCKFGEWKIHSTDCAENAFVRKKENKTNGTVNGIESGIVNIDKFLH